MQPLDPLRKLPPADLAMLRLLSWLAAADQHITSEERHLLRHIVARTLLANCSAGDSDCATDLLTDTIPPAHEIPGLVAQLKLPTQRILLARMARQMVSKLQGAGTGASGRLAEQDALDSLLALLRQEGLNDEGSAIHSHRLRHSSASTLLSPLPESAVRLHSDDELRLLFPRGFNPLTLRWETSFGSMPASLGELGLMGRERLHAFYAYRPRRTCPLWGLLLYPGGGVDFRAYALIARELASRGLLVAVQHVPFGFALFDHDRALGPAGSLRRHFPYVRHWVVAGHSLGGVAAACYARRQPHDVSGLVLWGAYPSPTHSLAAAQLPIASLCGSHDGLVPPQQVHSMRHLLPAHSRVVELEGANHTQFGDYWDGSGSDFVQRGDLKPVIGREKQRQLIVDHTHRFIMTACAAPPA